MSHAQTFGHFRSFTVGLERNARALRLVLEEQNRHGGNKKSINGEIAAKCARALECASAEATTKELVSEVAEQEKLLRAVEVMIRAQRPTNEEMEKYKALAEYNDLAFIDLEERLSAYGYVPQPVDEADVTVAGSPTRGGVTTSPSVGRYSRQRDTHQVDDGKARAASGNAHGNDILEKINECDPTRQTPVPHLLESNFEAEDPARGVGVEFSGIPEDRDNDENIPPEGAGDLERACVATPVHAGAVAFGGSDDDDNSPVTPKLAEWEISEETREALRLDYNQRQGGGDSMIVSRAAPARSLEVLLAENSILVGNCKQMEDVAIVPAASDGSNRFSMSSDWSPPHIDVPSPNVARGANRKSRRLEIIEPNVGSFVAGVTGDAVVKTQASPGGSDPPTPRMPSLEGLGDRDSVETPQPLFTSPMDHSLLDEALAGARRSESFYSVDAGHTPPPNRGSSRASRTPLDQLPRHHFAQVRDNTPDAEQMVGFWGADSTDSRQGAIGEPLAGARELAKGIAGDEALSPGTPNTPLMLSPRHGPDAAGGGIAVVSVHSTGADTHHATADAAEVGDDRSCDFGQDDEVSSNDDDCQTPELPAPPRTDMRVGEDTIVASAKLCRRRLEEADGGTNGIKSTRIAVTADGDAAATPTAARVDGPLSLVSEEEYARAPTFLTLQVSRKLLNDAIRNLTAYAAPRLATPSELLLTFDKIVAIINQGDLSRRLLLSAAHLKRVEVKGGNMYRIPGAMS